MYEDRNLLCVLCNMTKIQIIRRWQHTRHNLLICCCFLCFQVGPVETFFRTWEGASVASPELNERCLYRVILCYKPEYQLSILITIFRFNIIIIILCYYSYVCVCACVCKIVRTLCCINICKAFSQYTYINIYRPTCFLWYVSNITTVKWQILWIIVNCVLWF